MASRPLVVLLCALALLPGCVDRAGPRAAPPPAPGWAIFADRPGARLARVAVARAGPDVVVLAEDEAGGAIHRWSAEGEALGPAWPLPAGAHLAPGALRAPLLLGEERLYLWRVAPGPSRPDGVARWDGHALAVGAARAAAEIDGALLAAEADGRVLGAYAWAGDRAAGGWGGLGAGRPHDLDGRVEGEPAPSRPRVRCLTTVWSSALALVEGDAGAAVLRVWHDTLQGRLRVHGLAWAEAPPRLETAACAGWAHRAGGVPAQGLYLAVEGRGVVAYALDERERLAVAGAPGPPPGNAPARSLAVAAGAPLGSALLAVTGGSTVYRFRPAQRLGTGSRLPAG